MTRLRLVLALGVIATFGLAALPTAAALTPAPTAPVAPAAVTLEPVAGADRYATAIAISRTAYPGGAPAVVLASGLAWPDALAGSSLAGALGGPVLLTPPDHVRAEVVAEIKRLRADAVHVLGGPSAVREAVLAELRAGLPGVGVVRIAGANRYETAARVASAAIDANPAWDGQAFVARGDNYADALAVGPVAAALGRPLYLINEAGASAGVLAAMDTAGVSRATIVGSIAAVPAALQTRIAGVVGGAGYVERLQGPDRFTTALAIAAYAESAAGFTWEQPGLATSDTYPDAIASAPLLALRQAPLLLTPRAGLPDAIASALYARRATVAGFVCFGGTPALPAHVREEAQLALVAPHFDHARAMAHVAAIAGFGARGAGGTAERRAFDYVAAQLASYGYTIATQSVAIPGGKYSRNVIAEKTGARFEVVVLGAHVDSKPPSPGANDNASGVAVMLEMARVLATSSVRPTVRLIAFGAEEISGKTAADHHFGSRHYVKSLSADEQKEISAMVSIDMVGYGSTFNIRNLRWAPQTTVTSLQAQASFVGQSLPYLKDLGTSGWSDHEQFEQVGIPAAWLQWREDPVYHTARDTASHVQPSRVRTSGRLVRGWVLGMTDAELDTLR